MRIYTKSGDSGTTSLFGGKRINKNSARIEAYGTVDELNSQIGVIVSQNPPKDIIGKLLRIQKELFVLGTNLATPHAVKTKISKITRSYVNRLEKEIDNWNKNLPALRNFILPGGSETGAQLHSARTIARRAERTIVSLSRQEKINKNILSYVNRLSDWLFILARYVNKLDGQKEIVWEGRKNP